MTYEELLEEAQVASHAMENGEILEISPLVADFMGLSNNLETDLQDIIGKVSYESASE